MIAPVNVSRVVEIPSPAFVVPLGGAIPAFAKVNNAVIGFFVSAPIFLFVFSYAIGYRDMVKLTVFSLVTGLVVFFLFRNVVNIALPYGTGPFREISIWAANLF